MAFITVTTLENARTGGALSAGSPHEAVYDGSYDPNACRGGDRSHGMLAEQRRHQREGRKKGARREGYPCTTCRNVFGRPHTVS